MPATQISFAAFALAQQQAAPQCTPTVSPPATSELVAQFMGDEWACPSSDYAEYDRLVALANATFFAPLFHPWSNGGFVLIALANLRAPLGPLDDIVSRAYRIDRLRYHAATCIGAGC